MFWIDTHCHLDAPEFDADRAAVAARARAAGVVMQVIPAVASAHVEVVRALAHAEGLAYALGVHPLFVHQEPVDGLAVLRAALHRHADDARLVAVGEIGLDGAVPGMDGPLPQRFYADQLAMARELDLPVIVHVRRSADGLLKQLRRTRVRGGIAHAFNGSRQQAEAFIDLGFKLGLGGAMTFDRALQIRRLAVELPLDALVLETDAPDIPPHWLYRTAAERAEGGAGIRTALAGAPGLAADAVALASSGHRRNEPAELARIAQVLAHLRGLSLAEVASQTARNALVALPRLAALMAQVPKRLPPC